MAVHDLHCLGCDRIQQDVDIAISVGARAYCRTHCCPWCQGPLEPVAAIGSMSLFHEFEKFTTPIEDPASPSGFRDVTVSTLADIRRLERESEQAERNGEGRRMVWRDYSQDPSNRDKHTLGEDPSMKPAKTYTNGQPVLVRRGDPVTADHGTLEEG